MTSQIDSLIASLESVSVADIESEIASIDQQIKDATESLLKRRDALLAAKRIVAVRAEGAVQRKPRKHRKDKGSPRLPVATEPPQVAESGSILQKVRRHLESCKRFADILSLRVQHVQR